MRRGRFTIALMLASLLAAAGCSDFPQLDGVVSERARAADYPRILPLDQLLSGARGTGSGLGTLPARLSNLRGRAYAMRSRPVIDAASRARMMAALARHR